MTIHVYNQKCNIGFAHGWEQRFASPELTQLKEDSMTKIVARQVGKGVGKSSNQ